MDSPPPSPSPSPSPTTPNPSIFRWTLGFLLVGMAWGLTTPFIRRAAVNFHPQPRPSLESAHNSWVKKKILGALYTVLDLLRSPAYAVPLVVNLTGSVWFFLLIGKAGECSSGLGFGLTPAGGGLGGNERREGIEGARGRGFDVEMRGLLNRELR